MGFRNFVKIYCCGPFLYTTRTLDVHQNVAIIYACISNVDHMLQFFIWVPDCNPLSLYSLVSTIEMQKWGILNSPYVAILLTSTAIDSLYCLWKTLLFISKIDFLLCCRHTNQLGAMDFIIVLVSLFILYCFVLFSCRLDEARLLPMYKSSDNLLAAPI